MLTSPFYRWIERQPIVSFYILAFVISWSGMIPMAAYSRGLIPIQSPLFAYLGAGGPTLAALIIALLLGGKRGLRELFAPLLRWRVGIAWYCVALFWPPVIVLFAIGLGTLLGSPIPAFTNHGSWFMLLPIFLGHAVLGAPLEEVGWRGFALPKLQTKYSALASSLIVGVLWGLWHVPLFLQKGYPTPISSFPVWFVLLLGNAIVYTWIYNNTRGSLLLAILFHAAYNTVFPAQPSLLMAGLTWLGIIIIVALFGPARLSRTKPT
jgi:membrane protease YdiL (CAAX protease family)